MVAHLLHAMTPQDVHDRACHVICAWDLGAELHADVAVLAGQQGLVCAETWEVSEEMSRLVSRHRAAVLTLLEVQPLDTHQGFSFTRTLRVQGCCTVLERFLRGGWRFTTSVCGCIFHCFRAVHGPFQPTQARIFGSARRFGQQKRVICG